ncbi:hypothetical protein ABG067_007986, partial [Albugo candida]
MTNTLPENNKKGTQERLLSDAELDILDVGRKDIEMGEADLAEGDGTTLATKVTAGKGAKATLERLKTKYQRLYEQFIAACDKDSDDESEGSEGDILQVRLEKLKGRIEFLEKDLTTPVTVPQDKVGTAASKWAENKEVSRAEQRLINHTQLPACQLRNGVDAGRVWDDKKCSHDTIENFLVFFERVINFHACQIEDCWKRYISMCFHPDYNGWMDSTLLKCSTWKDARKMCIEKFGENGTNDSNMLKFIDDVRMENGETIAGFTNRFVNAAHAAQRKIDSELVTTLYKYRLHPTCHTQVFGAMAAKLQIHPEFIFTVDNMCAIARSIFQDTRIYDEDGNRNNGNRKRRNQEEGSDARKRTSASAAG